MPHGQLKIYNYDGTEQTYDAWDEWGVSLEDGSLGALLAYPPVKDRVTNSSRLEKGKRVLPTQAFFDSREVTLEMHLYASDHDTFITNYRAFIAALNANGKGIILTYRPYGKNLTYRLQYLSCTQFGAYNGTLAKFSLRFTEAVPNFGII